MFKQQSELLSCRPPRWALQNHVHTIAAYLMPSPVARNFDEKLRVEVSGGDELVSYYYKGTKKISLYLFHGLSGDTDSSYMQRTCILAQDLGAHVYLTNHRGCGTGMGLAHEPYHSGRTDDVGRVLALGRQRNPDHIHVAIGFSLSGNVVLLMASGFGVDPSVLPDYIISVNAPIHLEKAARKLSEGFNLVYDQQFVADAKRAVKARFKRNLIKDYYEFPKFLTVYRFDDIYTGHAAGYGTRENYYESCSAARVLSEIRVPTLILTSEDDPFVDVTDFKVARKSAAVQMHIEKYGGHLGYLHNEKLPFGGRRWLDYFLHEQISELMKNL